VRQEGALGGCSPSTAGRRCCACDNGPEFVACELTEWLEELGAATFHIEPGKPWQNGYGESLGARLRDECLNMEEFWSLPHAGALIEAWRIEYNSEHLHSSLGYLTPDEFAARCAAAIERDAACVNRLPWPTTGDPDIEGSTQEGARPVKVVEDEYCAFFG